MTSTTTTENTTAPVPAGWTWKLGTGEGQHWPLYVSPPDPDLEGRQDAIQVLLHTKSGGIRLSILQDLAGLETRDRVSEEFDGDYTSGGDVYFLDAEACAGLACWLLSALTIDDKFLDGEGLGRWMPKIEGAALKLTEAHTDRLHAEIDKITGQLGNDGDS